MRAPHHPPMLGGPIARLRRAWWLYIWRYKGELCQDCGGRYLNLVWHAPDDLFEHVTGQAWERNLAGEWIYREGDTIIREEVAQVVALLCPPCFSRRADAKGVALEWVPRRLR